MARSRYPVAGARGNARPRRAAMRAAADASSSAGSPGRRAERERRGAARGDARRPQCGAPRGRRWRRCAWDEALARRRRSLCPRRWRAPAASSMRRTSRGDGAAGRESVDGDARRLSAIAEMVQGLGGRAPPLPPRPLPGRQPDGPLRRRRPLHADRLAARRLRVGCALAASRQHEYLVCRYSPPGNVVGEDPLAR